MKHYNEPRIRYIKTSFCYGEQKVRYTKTSFCYKKNLNGFTLVELLVVIAIIGLMATFSLVAIARYRDKARDSKIETILSQTRSVAAVIYNETSAYTDLCKNDTLDQDNSTLNSALKTIEKEINKINGLDPVCYTSIIPHSYCVQAKLITSGYYCVDSTGVATEIADPNCTADNIKCSAP